MKTPQAEFEPDRNVTIVVHPVEAMELLHALHALSKEPPPFDSCKPKLGDLRNTIIGALAEWNPEYAKDIASTAWGLSSPEPKRTHAFEVHHHHYHDRAQRPRGLIA